MAKINWNDGSIFTPSYANTYFGNSAITGHAHTGVDTDGSAPKVQLESEATMSQELVTNCDITTTWVTVEQSSTITVRQCGNIVVMQIPEMSGTSNSTQLQLTFNGASWPSYMVSDIVNNLQPWPIVDNGSVKMGCIRTPVTDTDNFVFFAPDGSGNLLPNNFTASGLKGFKRGFLTFTNDIW
jgi:hypothetical protein